MLDILAVTSPIYLIIALGFGLVGGALWMQKRRAGLAPA